MNTTPRPHSASNPYRREQLVAAILVGVTVVLLGFASGLGTSPKTAAAAGLGEKSSSTPTTPSGSASSPTPTSPAPIHYVGVPEPGATPGPTTPAPTTGTPSTPAGSSTTAKPTSSPTSTATSTTPTVTPGVCPQNLLTGLLKSLSVGSILSGGGQSLLGGAAGPLPLTDVLGLLFGSMGKSGNALPALPLSTLTDLVGRLLSLGGTSAPSAAPMVSACTSSLASVVPIVGGAG